MVNTRLVFSRFFDIRGNLLRLKIRDSHVTCKFAKKCLNVCERVEVVE